MNAAGRRCREFGNGLARFAKVCGGSYRGGRRIYKATAHLSVAQAIERERVAAKREAARKAKKR